MLKSAYSSVTIKIIRSNVFSAMCWWLCYVLEIVLFVAVFIFIILFWNLKLLLILNRFCPLDSDPVEAKLKNDNSIRNSF